MFHRKLLQIISLGFREGKNEIDTVTDADRDKTLMNRLDPSVQHIHGVG
mgnify:CR=1 FL=1